MSDYPIIPPPEQVQQWVKRYEDGASLQPLFYDIFQAGANQELEACCEWLKQKVLLQHQHDVVPSLHAARRPKPKSLNSIAMQMLGTIERDGHYIPEITDTIRRALEQLDD
jgi:hypothetical protein